MFSYLICSYNPNIGKITAKTIPPTTTAKNTIISIIASQIENGTFEQYNKAKIIDKISGTRFDLKM